MKLYRYFNGKRYQFDVNRHNLVRAEARAEKIRKEGGLAEVVKVGNEAWEVWKREDKQ